MKLKVYEFARSFSFILMMVLGSLITNSCSPKAQESCGFVQNSYQERISWRSDLPVTFYIHRDVPEEYVQAVVEAAQIWGKAFGRSLFNIVTDQRVDDEPGKNGKNVIYFLNDWEQEKSTEQARTVVYWVGDLIREADIRVNAKDFKYYYQKKVDYPAVNVLAIFIHEMGHSLGLMHKDMGNSVMATYLASNSDRVQIAPTDIQSLKCEY